MLGIMLLESSYNLLLASNLLLLLLIFLEHRLQALFPLDKKFRIIAFIICELAALNIEDSVHEPIEEISVVGNNK